MSRKAYSEEEREQIRSGLMERAVSVFSEKGLRAANIDEIYVPVGISKTFFYTFFPSKLNLIMAIIDSQIKAMMEIFHTCVWRYGAENGIRESFKELQSGRFYLMTVDDQMFLRGLMSEEDHVRFQNDMIVTFSDILFTVGVPSSSLDPRVFGNMLMSILIPRAMDKGSTLLFYSETMAETTEIQLDQLIAYVLDKRVK